MANLSLNQKIQKGVVLVRCRGICEVMLSTGNQTFRLSPEFREPINLSEIWTKDQIRKSNLRQLISRRLVRVV